MGKPSNADNAPENDVFDVQRIRQLVELMHEYNLAEVDLRNGDMQIQLKGNVAPVMTSLPAQIVAAPVTAPVQQATPAPVAVDESHFVFVKSPMVGTFYAAQSPDKPAFVKVGDTVGPETTVCILEAMKVYNEIQAECSGKIVAVLVKNGEPVEFGKPLFKVDPRG